MHIDTDHVAARCQPQLPLAGQEHLPGLMLLVADQGVLAVGAEPPVGAELASGTGQAVVSAGHARGTVISASVHEPDLQFCSLHQSIQRTKPVISNSIPRQCLYQTRLGRG